MKRYLQLPDLLEAVITGLNETDLNLTIGEGWSIRSYIHHTVEGEWMWQLFLRAIVGRNGIEFPISWYFGLPQMEWARQWAYESRSLEPTLSLFHESTRNLVEFLQNISPNAWEHYGCVTWPDAKEETRLTVRDIVMMHIEHTDQHATDIRAIRQAHNR